MTQGIITKYNNTETPYKRLIYDRRTRPTPIISKYTFSGGKRKTIRRESDKQQYIFVDLYSTRLLLIVVSLFLLSCLDAYLTLTLIAEGIAIEANPLMASLLSYGVMTFIVIKFALTAFALLILCLFKNAKITRIGLPVAVKIYIALVIYEFYLFAI